MVRKKLNGDCLVDASGRTSLRPLRCSQRTTLSLTETGCERRREPSPCCPTASARNSCFYNSLHVSSTGTARKRRFFATRPSAVSRHGWKRRLR